MHFDLSDLKVFVAIAQVQNLTQGAKSIHLSAAAASTRLKNLEQQINARLFYRHNKGLELTPAGRKLLTHARQMLYYADCIRSEFANEPHDAQGHIRIKANTTAVIGFLPEILARFLAERPAVSIDLQEDFTKETIRAVREDNVDFGILSGQIDAPDLEHIPFKTDRLCIALPENHPLTERKEGVGFEEALIYPQISFHPSSTLQKYLNDHKERLGIYSKNRISVAGFESACRLIEAGVGIGIVPESVIQRHQATMRICAIPLNHPSAIRERRIIVKELDAQTPTVRVLIETICQIMGTDGLPENTMAMS